VAEDARHYANPEEWAAALEANLLHCRELGHAWASYTATYDSKSRSYQRTLLCSSCETTRVQVLDSRGEVLKNGYRYVDGYLAKGHFDSPGHKVPRATFRLAALQRMTGGPTPRRRRLAVAE